MPKIIWTDEKIKTEFYSAWKNACVILNKGTKGKASRLKIKCTHHGIFESTVTNAIRKGCPHCAGLTNYLWSDERKQKASHRQKGEPKRKGRNNPLTLTLEEVKNKIVSLHGNRYDLSFIKDPFPPNNKFTLVCSTHGKFVKHRTDILYNAKTGCPKCKGGKLLTSIEVKKRLKATQPKWISYSKLEYSREGFTITCKLHGDSIVKPSRIYSKGYVCKQCNVKRVRDLKVASGLYLDPKLKSAFAVYRQEVRRLSDKTFKLHFDKDTRTKDVHLDHVYSIRSGFDNEVPPEVIASLPNLRLLSRTDNQSKRDKCDISLKTLYKLYAKTKN